jgi:ABC-type multidrug transport system ATPase subunit
LQLLSSVVHDVDDVDLELTVCSIGNPSLILVDEFSTGLDAKTKRDMWDTLRNVAPGKAVLITTRNFINLITLPDA